LAIQTTGHNLANAATPGYSRQRAETVTAFPSIEGRLILGQGVHVTGVRRVVDQFFESELLSLNGNVGFTEAQNHVLAAIQEAFPSSGGIDTALGVFFSAMSDLANNPSGLQERVGLIGKAKALGETLRQTRAMFTTTQQNLDGSLDSAAQRVNVAVGQIALLNREIAQNELANQPANDFRDQRQILLQEVTKLTGATTREGPDGQVTVIADGLLLVGESRAASFDTSQFSPSGSHMLMYRSPDGLSFDATTLLKGGEIGGILNMRDTQVPAFTATLDQFAKTLVDQVNLQHALGFDLNGTAGGNFFTPIAAVAGAAAVVQVDPAVAADPRLIAAAQTAAGVPGDNRNALALTNLQSTPFAALGTMTLKDYFLALVGNIGSQVQTTDANLNFQNALLTQVQARRESVSGVDTDEEMTKLILFQRSFEAASRLVRTADDMYQTLIGMMR
jgi:flagellar hook-associated protein 1 FlgK